MAKNQLRRIILFSVGFVIGIALVAGAWFVVKKGLLKRLRQPKRYDAVRMVNMTHKEFNLPEGGQIFVASSLDRIFRDGKTLLPPHYTATAELSLAGNEYESLQVVVAAGKKPINGVELKLADLVKEGSSAVIGGENLSWRVVGYVPTVQPYYEVKYVGRWPDPLLLATRTDVPAGETQPFWVTVYAPPSAEPGVYRGKLEVFSNDTLLREIPFQVKVYGFSIPQVGRLKTAFDLYEHITPSRFPQGEKEDPEAHRARIKMINDRILQAMLAYRLNPILNVDPTDDRDLSRVDRYLTRGLNNFSIGKKGGTFNNNWPASDEEIEKLFDVYRTYGELLKLNKMLPYTYIYTWDEGKIGNPKVPKIAGMIHRAYPELKNMVCYHGFWNPEKDPEWGKDIDIWSFQLDTFNEEKLRKVQAAGKETWAYISGPSGLGFPNLVIDFDSIDYRITPWLLWKYDIKGLLYWCVNWWRKVDPFKSAANTKWDQNGNGLLFYPGPDGPLASLRVEILRDGLEDYEYTQILMDKLKRMKEQGLGESHKEFIDESLRLLTVDSTLAESPVKYTKDGEMLKARRDAIGRQIEAEVK
jgi:hypothetical protein